MGGQGLGDRQDRTIGGRRKARGCIDKILRKNISPKIKCKVWIIDMSMLSIYHLVSFSKKYPYHIYVGYQTEKFTLPVLPITVLVR